MSELNIKNKKASFQYEILEKYVAGIQLLGTEIKSIRDGKAALTDSYCSFTAHELYVKMYIGEYSHGGYVNHDPRRERKLLLQRKELNKLEKKVEKHSQRHYCETHILNFFFKFVEFLALK